MAPCDFALLLKAEAGPSRCVLKQSSPIRLLIKVANFGNLASSTPILSMFRDPSHVQKLQHHAEHIIDGGDAESVKVEP